MSKNTDKKILKNIVITCSDEKHGDFLIRHWLKSLKENVNLKNVDVLIIDYGLSDIQNEILRNEKVIIYQGRKNYHIVNKRFYDASNYLKTIKYDQVLFIDSSDIIFQNDFSQLFKKDKQLFRVVPLGMEVLFFEWFIPFNFEKKTKDKIWKVIKDKPVINAGVIFAPYKKFIELCELMTKLTNNKNVFGPDQIILNYFLYKSKAGYKIIDSTYNYMVSLEKFYIKDGIFYKINGEKVVIVHNAGQMDFLRAIDNFGYGKDQNKLNHFIYHTKRFHYSLLGFYKKIFSKFD